MKGERVLKYKEQDGVRSARVSRLILELSSLLRYFNVSLKHFPK